MQYNMSLWEWDSRSIHYRSYRSALDRPYIDRRSTIDRPYIDPRSAFDRPYIDLAIHTETFGALLVDILAFLATHPVRCSFVYMSLHSVHPY